MQSGRRDRVPATDALVAGLTSALSAILDRRLNPYVATHVSEIVSCRLSDGRELRILGKYGPALRGNSHGHRGGVLYEASVYRQVLRRQPCAVAELYGTYVDRRRRKPGCSSSTWASSCGSTRPTRRR